MHPRQSLRVAPFRWLREVAPIRTKLNIAFGISAGLTFISLFLGWLAFSHLRALLGEAAAPLESLWNALAIARFCLMAAAIATSYLFARIIAVPYAIITERMEGLANGDLDSPIPFTTYRDCVGRIANAMHNFRDNAIAKQKAAALNDIQAAELRAANAKLGNLARDLRQALDGAEHANRAKSRFLAGMSHELRTPLNGLLGYARLLRLDGKLNPVQDERVESMLAAGAHLLDMINRVLDLSEIESDRFALKPGIVEVRTTAMACLDIVRPTTVIKGLALNLVTAPGTPEMLVTDATRVRQVLLNLLGNAVKFTVAGGVEMRLGPGQDDATHLRIEVVDTGPGIPDTERKHLFEEFERLQAAVSGTIEGAGLGLALSLRLTHLLGGKIGYAENPAGGSIFWLELPSMKAEIAAADKPQASVLLPPIPAPVAQDRRLHVLVVDDIAMNREIAGAFLRAAGHDVAFAEGGVEAIRAAETKDYDVIVMDVRMPEMDGLEATRHIRALPPPHGAVPIVAMTAQAFSEQVVESYQAGMNGHVTKPFAPEVLCAAVAQAAGPLPVRKAAPLPEATDPARATLPAAAENAHPQPIVADTPAGAMPILREAGGSAPAFDPVVFSRTAGLLAPDVLVASLQTIATRGDRFLNTARSPGALAGNALELAEMAHTLGGCAGMFGFGRLAYASKRFEYAVQSNAPEAGHRASDLIEAVQQAREEIERQQNAMAASDPCGEAAGLGAGGDVARRGERSKRRAGAMTPG